MPRIRRYGRRRFGRGRRYRGRRGYRFSWARRRMLRATGRIARRAAAIVSRRISEKKHWIYDYGAYSPVWRQVEGMTDGALYNLMHQQFSGGTMSTCGSVDGRILNLRGMILELSFRWMGTSVDSAGTEGRSFPDQVRITVFRTKHDEPTFTTVAGLLAMRDERTAEYPHVDPLSVFHSRFARVVYDKVIRVGYPRPASRMATNAGTTTGTYEPRWMDNDHFFKKKLRLRRKIGFSEAEMTGGVVDPNSTPRVTDCYWLLVTSHIDQFSTVEEDWNYLNVWPRVTGFYTDTA